MKVDTKPYKVNQLSQDLDLHTGLTQTLFSKQDMFEVLSSKLGMLSVVMGLLVFLQLFMLFRGRKKSFENKLRRQHMEQALG